MPRDKFKPASSSSPRSTRSGAPTTWLDFLAVRLVSPARSLPWPSALALTRSVRTDTSPAQMERKRLAAENPNIKHKTLMRKAGAAWNKRKAELDAQQEEK
ncbi:uncharacterized protein JCM10292_002090 [Rhodotorula paludigena]|uniref:uncharacterized protein n=1 Tax=Rhodotorula paludigena TaxID=86838 RepID=UPI00316D6D0D